MSEDKTKDITRVVTCGVRWGDAGNSYADLMISKSACVLASGHDSITLFRSIKKGDLIALKDGYNIIALGKPELHSDGNAVMYTSTWDEVLKFHFNLTLSQEQLEEKAKFFEFSLYDKIDLLSIEEWLVLDPPIFYHARSSTVTIRNELVRQKCIGRFNELDASVEEYTSRQIEFNLKNAQHLFSQYTAMSNDDKNKAPLSEELLDSIDIVLNYESENEIAKKIKNEIIADTHLTSTLEKSKKLSKTYNKKAESLKKSNKWYVGSFIVILLLFIGLSAYYINYIDTSSVNRENLIVYIFTRGLVVSSMILSVFWIAKFLNRRVHENVYLIEEYKYKALMFGSLQNLKDVFGEKNADEVFKNIITKLIENPAVNLLKIKGNKSDETQINANDLLKLLSKTIPK